MTNQFRRAHERMLSGRRLDIMSPSPMDIEIVDIAHGLRAWPGGIVKQRVPMAIQLLNIQ